MTLIRDMAKRVLVRAPGVARPVAEQALAAAAERFLSKVHVWRDSNQIILVAQDDLIASSIPNTEIVRFESARLDGDPLIPKTLGWLDENRPDWRDETGDHGKYITQVNPGTVRVIPFVVGGVLDVDMVIKPTEDILELPDWVHAKYHLDLANGALADVLMIPNQPFTNPELAIEYGRRFTQAIDEHRARSAKGEQAAPLRTRPQFF